MSFLISWTAPLSGAVLFISVNCAWASLQNISMRSRIPVMKCGSMSAPTLINERQVHNIIDKMEAIVQKDEGNRGIKRIALPKGELCQAATDLLNVNSIAIITGFPCMIDYTPPTETDGPLGALAIAKSLILLGKNVTVLTDECNEEVVLACAAATGLHGKREAAGSLQLQSFPCVSDYGPEEEFRLRQIADSHDLVVAIERAGPNSVGQYMTMRGRDMSHLVAPLERILLPCTSFKDADLFSILEGSADGLSTNTGSVPLGRVPLSIGIGDGGNEVGMGKVYEKIVHPDSVIPKKEIIACRTPTDHLLVCSVSNWGGYALVASVTALAVVRERREAQGVSKEDLNEEKMIDTRLLSDRVRSALPSAEEEKAKCDRMVASGARDGVSGKLDAWVDGMPLQESLVIIEKLIGTCSSS